MALCFDIIFKIPKASSRLIFDPSVAGPLEETEITMERSLSHLKVQLDSLVPVPQPSSGCTTTMTKEIHNLETSLPLSVQLFPTVDQPAWDKDKYLVANAAERVFYGQERHFIKALSEVARASLSNADSFFDLVRQASEQEGAKRATLISQALSMLLPTSPKRTIAAFQKHSLEAGWSYVSAYNQVIDFLAQRYPRVRSGIYQSRLKYSDVLQISEEILSTIKACSILLEEIQRRFDLLEMLQGKLLADLENPVTQNVWTAIKEAFNDIKKVGNDDTGVKRYAKKVTGALYGVGSAVVSIPQALSAEFSGQLGIVDRVNVFFSTVEMLASGWEEWELAQKDVIVPNLGIMFALKRDYFRNQIVCLCDVITVNGYTLEGLVADMSSVMENSEQKEANQKPGQK